MGLQLTTLPPLLSSGLRRPSCDAVRPTHPDRPSPSTQEADEIIDALKQLIRSQTHLGEQDIEAHVDRRVLRADRLYGSSREQLLRENKLLRAQLEQRLVTSKTSRQPHDPEFANAAASLRPRSAAARTMGGSSGFGGWTAGSGGGGGTQGQVGLASLQQAAALLEVTSRLYRPAECRHVEVQADDGGAARLRDAEAELQALLLEKTAALRKLEKLTAERFVTAQKLENALDELSDLRRTKNEHLLRDKNLPADLRLALGEEMRLREAAEARLAEAESGSKAMAAQMAELQGQLNTAAASLQSMEGVLDEKRGQIETLQKLLSALSHEISKANEQLAKDTHDALSKSFKEQKAVVEGAVEQVSVARAAAVESTQQVTVLTAQQRQLTAELERVTFDQTKGMSLLHGELSATRSSLHAAEAERRQLSKQVLAASALGRMEDRRYARLMDVMMSDLPARLAQSMTAEMAALQQHTSQIATELQVANDQLTRTLGGAPGGGATLMGWQPGGVSRAAADDQQSADALAALDQSRTLRAQLHNFLLLNTGSA